MSSRRTTLSYTQATMRSKTLFGPHAGIHNECVEPSPFTIPSLTQSAPAIHRKTARQTSEPAKTLESAEDTLAFHKAAAEASQPLSEPLRTSLEQSLGADLSNVRVHSGPASDDAAQRIGAQAYALGTDIHLGRETQRISGQERDRLLTHETVHTLQQGSRRVAPTAGMAVSRTSDSAEQEAERVVEVATASHAPKGSMLTRDVSPHLQRAPAPESPPKRVQTPLRLVLYQSKSLKKADEHWFLKVANERALQIDAVQYKPGAPEGQEPQRGKATPYETGDDIVAAIAEAHRRDGRQIAEIHIFSHGSGKEQIVAGRKNFDTGLHIEIDEKTSTLPTEAADIGDIPKEALASNVKFVIYSCRLAMGGETSFAAHLYEEISEDSPEAEVYGRVERGDAGRATNDWRRFSKASPKGEKLDDADVPYQGAAEWHEKKRREKKKKEEQRAAAAKKKKKKRR